MRFGQGQEEGFGLLRERPGQGGKMNQVQTQQCLLVVGFSLIKSFCCKGLRKNKCISNNLIDRQEHGDYWRERGEVGEDRGQMVTEGDLPWVGKHTMQYTDDVF